METTDLFGEKIEIVKNYGAYAGPPGSGPQGKTCRDCGHYRSVQSGSRKYPKCNLMKRLWTHGEGSDIKARSPACNKFVPKGEMK